MMLTVYLSNHTLQVLLGTGGGTPAVKSVYTLKTPEGSLINGIVTDEDAFCGSVSAFWRENRLPRRGVQLVVNSTQLLSRTVQAPFFRHSAGLTAFLAREFSQEMSGPDPVFGYWEIARDPRSKTSRLLVTMAQRGYLEGLVGLFGGMGIQLAGISSALSCALRLLEKLPQVQGKDPCVVQVADGVSLQNILLTAGVYTHSTVARLYSDPGTEGYAREAAGQASGILQFAQSQKLPAVRRLYLAGMLPEDETRTAQALRELADGLTVERLAAGGALRMDAADERGFGGILYAAGALTLTGVRTGLLQRMGEKPEKRRSRRAVMRLARPVLVLAAVLLAACGALWGRSLWLGSRLAAARAFNTDPQVAAQCSEYDSLADENAALQAGVKELEDDAAFQDTYPEADSALQTAMRQAAQGMVEIVFSSYDAASGQLNLTTTAGDVAKINQYIAALRGEDVFQDVNYTGYAYDEAAGNWNVNVTCILSENAGK